MEILIKLGLNKDVAHKIVQINRSQFYEQRIKPFENVFNNSVCSHGISAEKILSDYVFLRRFMQAIIRDERDVRPHIYKRLIFAEIAWCCQTKKESDEFRKNQRYYRSKVIKYKVPDSFLD